MYSSTLILLLSQLFFSFYASTTPIPAPSSCKPSTSIVPSEVRKFYLQVDGSAEGEPELQVAWEFPSSSKNLGHLVLSDGMMTAPLLNYSNSNGAGRLGNQKDQFSAIQANDPNSFDSLTFTGTSQKTSPAFDIKNICSLEGQQVQTLVPRNDTSE